MRDQDRKWDFERWIQGVGRAMWSLLPVERLMGVVGLISEHASF
jgi:hypothetical protein